MEILFYDEQVCTKTLAYGESELFTCELPEHPANLSELRIVQRLTRIDRSHGAGLWAGMIDPIVVVKAPS